MKVLISIVIFSLIVVCGFAGYTTFGLPLIIPEAPPVEEKLTGEITMDQYIALGKKIFEGKGTCTLCHNPVGGRAPILDQVGQVASERLKDERYKAKATTVAEYLHESMVEPSAYVVAGFGKKGTNDTVSPMPDVSKGAIGLNEVEINAVIAFMQDMSGVEVTVALPTGDAGAGAGEEEAAPVAKVAANAAEAFVKFECGTCHVHPLIEEGGDMGPDLAAIGPAAGQRKPGLSAEQFLMESIVKPNAVIADGFEADTMPDDYASRMTVIEMNMIIDAILGKTPKEGGES